MSVFYLSIKIRAELPEKRAGLLLPPGTGNETGGNSVRSSVRTTPRGEERYTIHKE